MRFTVLLLLLLWVVVATGTDLQLQQRTVVYWNGYKDLPPPTGSFNTLVLGFLYLDVGGAGVGPGTCVGSDNPFNGSVGTYCHTANCCGQPHGAGALSDLFTSAYDPQALKQLQAYGQGKDTRSRPNQVMLSLGGADWPAGVGDKNPWYWIAGREKVVAKQIVDTMEQWEAEYLNHLFQFAGIDFDFEDSSSNIYKLGEWDAITMLQRLGRALKDEAKSRGRGLMVITGAPQGPYMCTGAEQSMPGFRERCTAPSTPLGPLTLGADYGGWNTMMATMENDTSIDALHIQYYPDFSPEGRICGFSTSVVCLAQQPMDLINPHAYYVWDTKTKTSKVQHWGGYKPEQIRPGLLSFPWSANMGWSPKAVGVLRSLLHNSTSKWKASDWGGAFVWEWGQNGASTEGALFNTIVGL